MIGEGAGVLVLEALETSRARAARASAPSCAGYGATADADASARRPPRTAQGARALHASSRSPTPASRRADVDYVNAHATSTPAGDAVEARAIRSVFGDARAIGFRSRRPSR